MDTTALSQLISALRAETQEESISPESLGALLQKIVDLLSNAGDQATVDVLNTWKNAVQSKVVVTDVAQSADDRNNINLSIGTTPLSGRNHGVGSPDYIISVAKLSIKTEEKVYFSFHSGCSSYMSL